MIIENRIIFFNWINLSKLMEKGKVIIVLYYFQAVPPTQINASQDTVAQRTIS